MAAPQLRLEVSLNLTGFRSEIQKLTNIAQSEFAPKINVKFNRQTLDTELNNLQAAIKRRTYRIEIGGNIDSFPRAIENIRKQLAALETQNKIEIPISVKNGVTQKEARKVRSSVYRSVMVEGGKILLPVGLKPVSQTASDKFKTDLRQKLGSITVKIKADLESASISGGAKSRSDIEADVRRGLEAISKIGAQRMAGGTGGVTEPARREQLKQSLSQGGFDIAALKEIGKQLGVAGVGRFKKANNLIEKIVTESSIEMVKKYLDPQAVMRNPDRSGLGKVLDTFARGIFNMLGMDPASIRAQQQASKPKPFAPAGLLPPAYRGIGPSAEPAGLLPPAYRGIGPSAKPAGLLPSLSSAGRGNAIIEALIASTGPRLLPSGGGDDSLGKLAAPRQTKDAVDAILRNYFKVVEAQVKEVFSAPPIKKESLNIFDHLDTEQYFNYLAQARINAENAIKQSIEEAMQVTKRNQIKDAAQSFLRALEEVVRNAERSAFTQSRIAANRSYVQKANIREIGQPLLGGRQVAAPKMLSAATGFYRGASAPPPLPETQAQLFARREREARMRSALRGVDVMGETPTRAPARYSYANRPAMPRRPTSAIVPYAAGGALVPAGGGSGGAIPPRPTSGGGGMGGMANFGKALGGINLPGAGVVREIGSEFAMAAKQVLLFGTAYKALAFLTSFPSQVGEAIGAMQSFRNTLNAISPTAQEAAASSAFILNIVDKYNVPLQSARDGFTKLYASMAPTGFSGNEIRDLFTGISQAAATFGMSSDKVDRVTYAFAQMASKGQVMSEELKGQLGDVLPGAMGIFAKAAGFKGSDAIQKFGKALEDGAYKGKPMRDLLKNVTIELQREFGPGAEGAARTYQGAMNRMANSTKLLYEAFEPIAVGFLNSVVVPLTSGIKTVADGFNSFFTGTNAKTTGGFAFAQELEKLRPTFEGIRANVTALMPTLQSFASTLLGIGKVFLQIAGNPFIGYLGRVYLNVLALTTAINILNLRALIPMIANFVRSAYSLIVFTTQVIRAAFATGSFGVAVRTAGLMLRTFFASTGVGLVLVGIGLLTERFLSMNQALADTKAKAAGAADAIRAMSQTEARTEGQSRSRNVRDLKSLELAKGEATGNKKQGMVVRISEDMAKRFEESGIPVNRDIARGAYIEKTAIASFRLREEGLVAESESRQRTLKYDEQQAAAPTNLPPITGLAATEGKSAADKAAKEAARLASQQQQNSIDAANRQNALNQAVTEGMMSLDDQAFQHRIDLIDARNNYELAGLNSIEARQEKFQQDLQKIELDRINTVRKAQQEVQKASLQYAAAQNTAVASQGSAAITGQIDKSVLRDWLISQGFGRTTGDFTNKGHATPNHMLNAMDMGILGGSDADALRKTADMEKKLRATGAFGSQLFGPTSDPYGHGAGKGGQNIHLHIPTPGGKVNMTPGLSSLMGQSGPLNTMQRREDKAGGRLEVEQQQLSNQQIEAGIVITNAANKALAERKSLIASNVNTIFPVAEQRLENDLMKIRNQLQLQGMPQEYIDFQERQYKGTYEAAESIKKLKEETVEYRKDIEALQAKQVQGKALTEQESETLRFKVEAIKQNDQALTDLTEKQKAYNIASLESAIASMKNADSLKAQQDTLQLIEGSVESASNSYKGFLKEVATGGDPSEALKKFQEAITDQVLTVFFDFAMKPVEDFFKNQLSAMFGVETEESAREKAIVKMEEQLAVLKAIETNTAAMAGKGEGQSQSTSSVNTAMQSVGGVAFDASIGGGQGFDAGSVFGNPEALSGAFTGIQASISESMNGIVSSFEGGALGLSSVLPSWSEALATDIPNTLKQSSTNTGTEGNKFQESLGKVTAGIGIAASAIMGIAAGIGQIKEGGTANILGGIGSIFLGVGGALGGIGSLIPKSGKAANGAVWKGGFQAFANGGMVTGPTLGLIGEGKYNEAIVPLPDGRSIPVQFNQQSSLREAMAGGSNNASAPSVLSMTFESTNINGVEYVSRDQLEQAMAQTRRQASRDGAQRGMTMTLDKLQQSPSTRSRLGMR